MKHIADLINLVNDNKAFLTLASAWIIREGSLITNYGGLYLIIKRFCYNPLANPTPKG